MRMFTQILLGVNFLHRNNIDHRDLKPANIIYFNEGEILKLADFGLARSISSEMTKMTIGVGTEAFLAPEAQSDRLTPVPFKSEMYSLGLILHFMLTKSLPKKEQIHSGEFIIPDMYTTDVLKIL